jgi:hypothetical protein
MTMLATAEKYYNYHEASRLSTMDREKTPKIFHFYPQA